jgi:hypothetical protein
MDPHRGKHPSCATFEPGKSVGLSLGSAERASFLGSEPQSHRYRLGLQGVLTAPNTGEAPWVLELRFLPLFPGGSVNLLQFDAGPARADLAADAGSEQWSS